MLWYKPESCKIFFIWTYTTVDSYSSLEKVIFPDILKLAKVPPLWKKDNVECFSNYRSISLLTWFSKIFEKVTYNQLMEYLDKLDILYKFPFGFQKEFGTEIAVSYLTSKIYGSSRTFIRNISQLVQGRW